MEVLNQSQQVEESQSSQGGNLQESFKKFRKNRQERYQHHKYLKSQLQIDRTTAEWKENLRNQFVEQAKKYFGVPYSKKYLTAEDALYNSPLFLDCCGLVRQLIYDLREEFGFTLGRWNQAYQFDTLPNDLTFEQLKPGDLIFISGDYFNTKLKPFQHHMVHVEIFTGGETGEQTIGARWQKGVVQYHDSYKFVSKNYGNMKYYYKSLDTWLEGKCQSYCDQHPWRDDRDNWIPDKYSVFADAVEEEDDQGTNNEQNDKENKENIDSQNIISQSLNENKLQNLVLPIFVGKGNNDLLVRSYFSNVHKYSILDQSQQFSSKFYFKWAQTTSEIDFFSFKEGKQIVCHIPNSMQTIASKSTLLQILNESQPINNYSWKDFFPETYQLDNMADEIAFLNSQTDGIWILKPKNLNQGKGIQIIDDIKQFKEEFLESKKFYLGDYVTNWMIDHKKKDNSKDAVQMVLNEKFNKNNDHQKSQTEQNTETAIQQNQEEQKKQLKYENVSNQAVIQKYIEKPLLLENRKFDIRCYVLIASTKPAFVLFHHGYLRLCMEEYSLNNVEDLQNRFAHISNAAIQKKHPKFKELKENTIWSMTQFENFCSQNYYKTQNDFTTLYQEIQKICCYNARVGLKKLEKKVGYYELYGFDIIVDQNFKPYLLEININPALFLDCKGQKEIIPKALFSTLDIVLQLNEDPANISTLLNNETIIKKGEFVTIYNEITNYSVV